MKLSIRTFGLVSHLAPFACFELAVNSSRAFPACEGKLISKTFGVQDGPCMSLSGDSSAAEVACKQSYDIDAAGVHWQRVVESKSSGEFTCRHSHMFQHEGGPGRVGFPSSSQCRRQTQDDACGLRKDGEQAPLPGTPHRQQARNMAPKSRRTRWLFAAMQVRF